MTTQLTIDYRAVSHAKYWYENWCGMVRRTCPKLPTFNGVELDIDDVLRVKALKKPLDKWTPHVRLQLRNNHSLCFSGEAATKHWKAYNKTIYGKH